MEKRKRILVAGKKQAEESLEEWEIHANVVRCEAVEIEPAMHSHEPDVLVTIV